MKRILVIGSTNIDFVVRVSEFPVAGETVMSQSFQKVAGGKGANQAYACGKLGADTTFASVIGDDGLGKLVVNNLREAGVCTDYMKTVTDKPTGMAQISINQEGNNCIIVIPGANQDCDAAYIGSIYDLIENCDILLIQMEIPVDGVEQAIRKAKEAGKIVILNPAPAPDESLSDETFANLTYITPNETELEKMTGMKTSTIENVAAAGRKLLQRGVLNVIVTLGEKGALLLTGHTEVMYEAVKRKAVDTTAAGDIFNAAVAVKLAQGESIDRAIRFANVASGISVTRQGAQPSVPSREEVEALTGNLM